MATMPEPRTIAAEIARTERYRPDADTTELRRKLHAAKIAKFIRETADKFPPLNDDQRATIGLLLKGGQHA
ncbi:hypothetical protein ABT352_14850 [Streptosporangium sp. NPDC000563]|uniref:hypothetical protein n=1 Tax=Streptosporangium sp. NPDC000563 TaxID=3154366 RepID=UPI00332B730D